MDHPKLYTELARWWPLLSPPEEYEEEAATYVGALLEASSDTPRTLLELGSGGGNNASHMKRRFEEVVLVDRAPGMLAVSRALNPDCEHLEGDMRTVRLGRQFDCVFVHDAICYITTEDDLRRVAETAFVHCQPGGAAVIAPDFVRESFRPGTEHGGHDGHGRGLRYLEWTWDPDPADTVYLAEYAYLLRDEDGSISVVHDRHEEGLFPRAVWLRILADAGFEAISMPFEHSQLEHGSEILVAKKPRV
jgi:SAM-dependent methyltransferase